MKLTRKIALLLFVSTITLGSFTPLSLAEDVLPISLIQPLRLTLPRPLMALVRSGLLLLFHYVRSLEDLPCSSNCLMSKA